MARVMPPKPALRVGDWTVEPDLNRVSAPGKDLRLEAKPMSVLVYLADRAGQVIGREELLSAIWPGVVVGDDSLTQVVIKLRKALGDAPDNPTYIQTISKRGYRLIAPVTRTDPGEPGPSPAARAVRGPGMAAAGGVALLLVAVVLGWWMKPAANASVDPRTSQPTIAVQPFATFGNDAQAVPLAEGITADLVTDLSKLSGLSVIGFAAAGGREAPSGAMPARYLVSGSVQRVDQRLRVHVRLTDAQTGQQLWSERYGRALSDLFAIQDELGPKILPMLPAKVSEAEMRRVAQRHTRNLEAYEHFRRGQSALLARQRAENDTAREMFRRAIALDARFARAYAGLALTHAADYRNQWSEDGAASLERAFELAKTAYEIEPDIAETYWVLAFVHLERRQHEQALQYLRTAIRLYPSFADGYALMGGINTYIGRPAETLPLMRTAMRLAPEAGHLYFLLLGRAYLFTGDLEQARVNLEHALSRNPANLESHVYMAALLVMSGDMAAAAWEAEEIRTLQPGFSVRGWLETGPMTDAAQKEKLVRAMGAVGL